MEIRNLARYGCMDVFYLFAHFDFPFFIFFFRFAAQCQSLERIENDQKMALEKLTSTQADTARK